MQVAVQIFSIIWCIFWLALTGVFANAYLTLWNTKEWYQKLMFLAYVVFGLLFALSFPLNAFGIIHLNLESDYN